MTKASAEDIEKTRNFLHFMETLFDTRSYRLGNRDWENAFSEDSEEYGILKRNQKEIAEMDGCNPDGVDDRLVIYEAIKELYKRCDCRWGRVVWAASILIDNCCDPSKDYLAWHPVFERAIENGYFGE